MNSDIRFLVKEHAITRDFPECLIYGELCGPVVSGEFSGSQVIRVVSCPDWAPTKYSDELAGRLIPTALTNHGFDFPLRDITTGHFRKFLVYATFERDGSPHQDIAALVASAESYADALEHAYAHARYKNGHTSYSIVDRDKQNVVCHSTFYPNDPAKSWVWEAA